MNIIERKSLQRDPMKELVFINIHKIYHLIAFVCGIATEKTSVRRQFITGDKVAVPVILFKESLQVFFRIPHRRAIYSKDIIVIGETAIIIYRIIRIGTDPARCRM